MRQILIFITSLFSLTLLAQAKVNHVDAHEFNRLIQQDNGVVLDVRTQGEYSRGHIANATLISTSDRNFVKKAMLLQKDKPLYVYCLSGSRSSAVVNYLSQQGFTKLYNLSRGTMDWTRSGYTLVKSQNVTASASKSYTSEELNQILQSNRLTLIDFYAPWCAPCKKIKPIVQQAEKDYAQTLNVVMLDVEANESLQKAHNIASIPGLVLYKNGKEVWRKVGVVSKEELYNSIQKFL